MTKDPVECINCGTLACEDALCRVDGEVEEDGDRSERDYADYEDDRTTFDMRAVYGDILRKLEAGAYDSFAVRHATGTGRKLALLAMSLPQGRRKP